MLLTSFIAGLAFAGSWPGEDSWIAAPIREEPCGDSSGGDSADLIGVSGAPVASWARDDSSLWLRIRLNDDPIYPEESDGDWQNIHWLGLLELDWDKDLPRWDLVLSLDGREGEVTLWREASSDGALTGRITLGKAVQEWDAPAALAGSGEVGAACWRSVDMDICDGESDAYVELEVPLEALRDAWGADLPETIGWGFASVGPEGSIWDIAGCAKDDTLCDTWSELLLDQDYDGDGLSNADEVTVWGTDLELADTDGGGEPDGREIERGTDPLDPNDDVQPPLGPLQPDDGGALPSGNSSDTIQRTSAVTGVFRGSGLGSCSSAPTGSPLGLLLLGLLIRRR